MTFDLSPTGWGRVVVSTAAGTAICLAATLYVDSFNFPGMTDEQWLRAIVIDVTLPLALAVPFLLFFASKLRELAIAHRQLTIVASTDGLTQVLNRVAFSTLVDAYLREVKSQSRDVKGALLIIDADNFKSVNDSFGHDRGDEALITIAGAIKSTLRSVDLVGRLGGEEFGVFLPGASDSQAEGAAERTRRSVNEAIFAPSGAAHRLSVSVGGAVFKQPLPFADLFRQADQQLYAAKRNGRNRVAIAPSGANSQGLAAA